MHEFQLMLFEVSCECVVVSCVDVGFVRGAWVCEEKHIGQEVIIVGFQDDDLWYHKIIYWKSGVLLEVKKVVEVVLRSLN